jgi:ubiquinone/menaquinone biosynthesis C-methylase UbiE
MATKKEWIYSFFGSFYQEAYEGTEVFKKRNGDIQAEQLIQLLNPPPGAHILDWCGGWGRVAIPLAKRGFKVTVLDFCQEYLRRAERDAEAAGVKIKTVHADFRKTPADIQADFAINMFTAGLGYLNQSDDELALASLFRALKPGAKFLIDTMSLLWVAKNFSETSWQSDTEGLTRLLEKRKFDFLSGRMNAQYICENTQSGRKREEKSSLYIYSPAELAKILERTQFKVMELYGELNGNEFAFDSKRIVMISRKPNTKETL